MINVTKTFLPDLKEYTSYLEKIWNRGWVTNNGPLVQELEQILKDYLNVKHLILCNNGTVVLQMAIKALDLKGEILTTPFSYVATTNSILWENCTPVFVDIKSEDYNIDPSLIEAKITSKTVGILATHVFGNPCDIQAIATIALKNNLKVIYDGAHAFDSKINGSQILSFGDISTCSLHATKLFHSVEGGFLVTSDDDLAAKLKLYRQFGHIYDDYYDIGINGKMSEFHAAMGLCVFTHLPEIKSNRKSTCILYDELLKTANISKPYSLNQVDYNYAYYPVVFENEATMMAVKTSLNENKIFPRRYFYPSLNTLPFLESTQSCPVSESVAKSILCLPLSHDQSTADTRNIAELLLQQTN